MKQVKVWLLLPFILLSQCIWAQNSPVPMLKSTADSIVKVLQSNQSKLKQDKSIIYNAVSQYLLPNVDVYGMSRSVLGRKAWRDASKSQRRAFADQFTQLVIRTYASPLAEYNQETIKFLPLRGGYNKRFISVKSLIIRQAGNTIPLTYSLVNKKGRWKIYDINVEGVSLLQSYRSQFSEQLRRVSMDDLIKQMKTHNIKQAG